MASPPQQWQLRHQCHSFKSQPFYQNIIVWKQKHKLQGIEFNYSAEIDKNWYF